MPILRPERLTGKVAASPALRRFLVLAAGAVGGLLALDLMLALLARRAHGFPWLAILLVAVISGGVLAAALTRASNPAQARVIRLRGVLEAAS
ncbi:MAG: hypothetical protein ABI912_07920, partial [Actinomycetota bacterium]